MGVFDGRPLRVVEKPVTSVLYNQLPSEGPYRTLNWSVPE